MNKFFVASIAAILIAPAYSAHDISGKIVDQSGNPIANVKIEFHGSNLTIYSDKQGQFSVSESIDHVDEIHISARGYNHLSFKLEDQTDKTLSSIFLDQTIVLTPAIIEHIDVYATPLHGSTLESATPITVLSDSDLKNKHSATLGETLKAEVGVHSTYYGPVSSSPIIRGLDGPRVMISQNGLDVGDASRVGPDHVVSTETSTVKQIEILRGPATLFYGSGAIGGVINIVDNRIPTEAEDSLNFQTSVNSASNETEFAFDANTTYEQFAFHLDAFWRDSDDLKVPANPTVEDEHDEHDEDDHDDHDEEDHDEHDDFDGTLENSASESSGYTFGTSYLLDNGFVGVSYGELTKTYGIPGHAEHSEEESEEEHDEHEAGVVGDMEQKRFQMISELSFDNQLISAINTKFALTNYQHAEIEDGQVGTTFNSDTTQLKSDFLLAEIAGWHGAISLEYKQNDFEAIGDEAFTPPSTTQSIGLGMLAEKHFDNILVQLGARIESTTLTVDELSEIEHDEEEDEHDHEAHGHEALDLSMTPVSLSAGIVWDFAKGYNLGLSYSRSERAPSAGELVAFGPHIGTKTFEIGALYDIEQEGDEYHVELLNHSDIQSDDVKLETANNLELSLRKFSGDFGFVFNAFYNQIDNYYYQQNQNWEYEFEHSHGEEEVDEDDHEEHEGSGLPVYLYSPEDVKFMGIEGQFTWRLNPDFKLTTQFDSIIGELSNGDALPRIPPSRVGFRLNYELDATSIEMSYMETMKQSEVTDSETPTDGYSMLDFVVSHHVSFNQLDLTAFVKGNNLLNSEARVHTSFLKNETLLPSRGFTVGVRGQF